MEIFLNAIEDDDSSMIDEDELALSKLISVHLQSELMFLKLFRDQNWRVPKSYGACGRLYIVEWVGPTISESRLESWEVSNKITKQSTLGAWSIKFTPKFSVSRYPRYLTNEMS